MSLLRPYESGAVVPPERVCEPLSPPEGVNPLCKLVFDTTYFTPRVSPSLGVRLHLNSPPSGTYPDTQRLQSVGNLFLGALESKDPDQPGWKSAFSFIENVS